MRIRELGGALATQDTNSCSQNEDLRIKNEKNNQLKGWERIAEDAFITVLEI